MDKKTEKKMLAARISIELHTAIAVEAAKKRISMQELVEEVLEKRFMKGER